MSWCCISSVSTPGTSTYPFDESPGFCLSRLWSYGIGHFAYFLASVGSFGKDIYVLSLQPHNVNKSHNHLPLYDHFSFRFFFISFCLCFSCLLCSASQALFAGHRLQEYFMHNSISRISPPHNSKRTTAFTIAPFLMMLLYHTPNVNCVHFYLRSLLRNRHNFGKERNGFFHRAIPLCDSQKYHIIFRLNRIHHHPFLCFEKLYLPPYFFS
jgi:hypothetical protein